MARRYPALIGNFPLGKPGEVSPEGLHDVIVDVLRSTIAHCNRPGLLLSGGIDSATLALLAKQIHPTVRCFNIAGCENHPDRVAAIKLARECNLRLEAYIPTKEDVAAARASIKTSYPGDDGVWLALRFASTFVGTLLATDGIDELMGGYWWHVNPTIELPTSEIAFQHFWDQLEPAHLTPMWQSAQQHELDIYWIYLNSRVLEYISHIPLSVRISSGVTKAFWRKVARLAGVPEWVIARPKKGFVDALDRLATEACP